MTKRLPTLDEVQVIGVLAVVGVLAYAAWKLRGAVTVAADAAETSAQVADDMLPWRGWGASLGIDGQNSPLFDWFADRAEDVNGWVKGATESSLQGDAAAIANEVGGDPLGLNPGEIT